MLASIVCIAVSAAGATPHSHVYRLTAKHGLEANPSLKVANTVYRGKRAVVLTEDFDTKFGLLGATVVESDFHNGTIDFDAAGELTKNASQGARSFVGLAFRMADDAKKYECFYLRMTNGRSPDQELRNHAVQYCSYPDYLWSLLRTKRPFRYEAYTDLQLGTWTHVKISVHGAEAKFYVGHATQPTLIVHNLLMGDTHGKLALWVGGYTRAYYANLRVRPA